MEPISELDSAIEHQTRLVDRWRQPSEPLLFETVRALDNVFCEELFYGPEHPSRLPSMDKTVMTWGVNQALERMVPDVLKDTQFRLFPSRQDIQRQGFPRYRAAVFVHGCFWHRHEGCRFATTPATRSDFWAEKFQANVARDRKHEAALLAANWRVAIVWECDIKSSLENMPDELASWLKTEQSTIMGSDAKKKSA